MKNVEKTKNEKMFSAYSLALSLGYMIVIPVVFFGGGGVLLDKYLDSFPIFVFTGFVLAMTTALITVYIKTKDIIIAAQPKNHKKDVNNK